MKKYDQIHESVLKDIFDVYNDIKELSNGELADFINRHRGRRVGASIARTSNDLICVFPVLASRNISIDTQAMATKAIEKNCVSMLQIIFSAFQLSSADNAAEFIQQFHTNINKSAKMMDIDDVIKISDMLTEGAIKAGAKVDMGIVEQVKRDMRNLNYYFEDTVSSRSIEESFTCKLDPTGDYIVQIQEASSIDPDAHKGSMEVEQLRDTIMKLGGINNGLRKSLTKTEKERDTYKGIADKVSALDIERKQVDVAKGYAQVAKDQTEALNKQVLNTEYKKANELMPTLMVVNFKSRVGDRYELVDSVIIGVKAKLYPISSDDMITHLVAKAKDANWIQKLIKASTREISFFKDFLFSIDKAKIDALSMSRKGSANKMWKVLERRAVKNRWSKFAASSNDATPITTIMISQNEVDFIKKEYQIDISDAYNCRVLMNAYNLLGICIIDESLEIAKFMWDTGEDLWETVAFSHLEKEASDNTYKKVVNLMTKVM